MRAKVDKRQVEYALGRLEEKVSDQRLQYVPDCATESDRGYFLALHAALEETWAALKTIAGVVWFTASEGGSDVSLTIPETIQPTASDQRIPVTRSPAHGTPQPGNREKKSANIRSRAHALALCDKPTNPLGNGSSGVNGNGKGNGVSIGGLRNSFAVTPPPSTSPDEVDRHLVDNSKVGTVLKTPVSKKLGVNVDRLREARRECMNKNPTGSQVSQAKARRAAAAAGNLFDTMDSSTRARMLADLEGDNGEGPMRRTSSILRSAILAVYSDERGRATGNKYVQVGERGRDAAVNFAKACLGYQVHPREVIAYWLNPANNFTSMKFPSLVFVATDNNLDRAAASIKPAKTGSKYGAAAARKSPGHGYSDTSELHPDLRRTLEEAGFDLAGVTDRALMTTQGASKTILMMPDTFMSDELRSQAEAVKHLFAEEMRGKE